MTPSDHASQAYLEICGQMGARPLQQFLSVLQSSSRIMRVTAFESEVQLYATLSLLPYANIEELELSGLRLSLDGWCALLDACSKCQSLQVLGLKGCALGALGEEAEVKIANGIGACRVVVLDVSQNGLGDTFLQTLGPLPLVSGGDRLTVLDLSENAISDEGLAVLAGILEVDGLNCPVKQLDLSFNRLQDKGACALASMLSCVPLLALELEGNEIGDTGSMALASALKGALCLQRLNLNHNKFSSSTLAAVADALRVSTGTLQELALAGASGHEDGLALLLQAACSSKHLQLLDIRGLPMRAAGVDALCELIGSPAPLVTMRLDVATKEAAEAVAQALPRNTSLLHLMMTGPVPEHVLSFVAASLSSNTLSRLQQQQGPGSIGCSPQHVLGTPPSQQQQQQLWSPKRPASAGPGASRSSPGSFRNRTHILGNSNGGKQTPPRPASAGLLSRSGNSSSTRSLVRTTTQQARHLATIDPTGLAGLTAGGVANKAAEVFRRHDSDGSGYLDAEEMMSALQDLGMLENMKARQLGKFLSNAIKEADVDKDGRVSLDEFIKYYERLARYYAEAARQGRISARRKPPAVPLDAPANDHLKRVFRSYCKLRIGQGRQVGMSVQHINAAQFNQMCRDAGLLEPHGPLSQCAVDIVFTRCKPPGSRRLSFKEIYACLKVDCHLPGRSVLRVYCDTIPQLSRGAHHLTSAGLLLTFLEAVASVAEEAGCSFDEITQVMEVISYSSPPISRSVSPVSTPAHLVDTDFDPAGPGVIPAAVARGCLAEFNTTPRISDLSASGLKVGPAIPGRPASTARSSMLCSIHDGDMPAAPAWGSAAGISPAARASPRNEGQTPGITSGGTGGGCGTSPSATFKASRMSLSSPINAATPGAGVRLPGAARAGQTHSPNQTEGGVCEPDAAGEADASAKTKAAVEARLKALELKLGGKLASKAAGIPAGTHPGDIISKLLLLEAAVAEQQQQLAAVVGQQEAFKEVVTKLVESMKALKAQPENSAGLQELSKQVKGLAADVSQVMTNNAAATGLAEKLMELSRKTEDRQTRAETAIYQVARQVDVLDARLKDEQESSLKALEALLANASPAK